MGLETGTYLDDLVVTNPTATDLVKFGDDHLRLIKTCLVNSFPNVNGAVNPTPTEFNYLVGVTSLIQTQLDAKLAIATADGAGLTESGGVLAVGAGLGVAVNADDVQVDISGLTAIASNDLDSSNDGFLVDDNGVPKRMSFSDSGFRVVDVAGTTETISTGDLNTVRRYTNAAGCAVTLNTGVGSIGNWMVFIQYGAAAVTTIGTATVNGEIGVDTSGTVYSGIVLLCVAANTWVVLGAAG